MLRTLWLLVVAAALIGLAGCSDKKAETPTKNYEAPKTAVGTGSPSFPNPPSDGGPGK
jgi:uncharacterized lipoprotein